MQGGLLHLLDRFQSMKSILSYGIGLAFLLRDHNRCSSCQAVKRARPAVGICTHEGTTYVLICRNIRRVVPVFIL